MPTTLVWFRRDLRVADNPALAEAARRGDVVCVWVADPGILGRRHHRAPARLRFLRAGLEALDAELRERGVRLFTPTGRPEEVLPALAARVGADRLHHAREVSPLGLARDRRVATCLETRGVTVAAFDGDLIVPPDDLPGASGDGYLVFTPFHRAWAAHDVPPHLPAPGRLTGPDAGAEPLDALPSGAPAIPAGPAAARAEIIRFIRSGAADAYDRGRDLLAEDGTSRLSPYLRLGMCTAAQVGRALGLPGPVSPGRAAVMRQLAWREFYHHHLLRRPEVARTALRPALRGLAWSGTDADLAAWRDGLTGYPLVDAGMRQLAELGWMHNRARMVAASFLVKDLLIDWRRGETVFMRSLLDGDPANNNGGWQWTAGTGTDAAPWFRILSPTRQAVRFDPDGAYIRRWVPELRRVPAHRIHEPWRMGPDEERASGCRIGSDYPAPRVDHAARRGIALDLYRAAAAGGTGAEGAPAGRRGRAQAT